MLDRLFRASFFIVLLIALIASVLFAGWTSTYAATPGFTPPEDYRKDDSLGIANEPSEENLDDQIQKDEMNLEDIFGSEQVFPFEMGLGNSAF